MEKETLKKILLFTPPFTQLNTPYPATIYLKGFLNTLGISSFQVDLSIEVFLSLFSFSSLSKICEEQEKNIISMTESCREFFHRKDQYIFCLDPVISFLQGNNPGLVHLINKGDYLPKGSKNTDPDDLDWAFGTLGSQDKARYLATLYIEEIGNFIKEQIDDDFGFSKYAERLARTASDFTPLFTSLEEKKSIINDIIRTKVSHYILEHDPQMVCITAPFPGNVYGAFYIAKIIKELKPKCITVLGGGYVNTELRRITDERVFKYFDHLTLDDGESPLQHLLEYYFKEAVSIGMKRTFSVVGNVVIYQNTSKLFDIPQRDVGTPDYTDLHLDQYISVIEILNPMHRKWSDGRWNKMTLAHGCYWGKCSFCDITLDYIKRYEPVDAALLCDRIESIIHQTGENGFHFVDEAAPPSLMKDLAIELLKRRINISWWTNIRFEKSFTYDLCRLLSSSGCIAVTGGLEVASDRLLMKMEKGVTVSQVAKVSNNFTKSNILVHAYLMYGFPTQTEQETIDSLEVVRQMMELGIINSGFWHQFAMTAHSPVGINPEKYSVLMDGPEFSGFAENDYFHIDPLGANHDLYSDGLKTSVYNFMQGVGFDIPLQNWFSFKIPKTTLPKNYIQKELQSALEDPKPHNLVIWIGGKLVVQEEKSNIETISVCIYGPSTTFSIEGDRETMLFLLSVLPGIDPKNHSYKALSVTSFSALYTENVESRNLDDFLHSYLLYNLREAGLLFV
jgi:radical SAM superfamily enzyme YgiQ (UPF0313 family)